MAKKVIEPFNIHLDAFWPEDLTTVEKMIRKLDAESIRKLYGMTITITDKDFFPHPETGEPMVGDTRFSRGKPYLIIVGKNPTPRILYHEVAHAIGIDDEVQAMAFAREKERNPMEELPRTFKQNMDTLTRLLPLPSQEFRSEINQLVERNKTQEALNMLGNYYKIEPPKYISLTEAKRIDPAGYEDFVGSGAEAAHIPSTDYLIFLPEVVTQPRHVVHEFFEYVFDNIRPPLLLPDEVKKRGDDYLALLMDVAWRYIP